MLQGYLLTENRYLPAGATTSLAKVPGNNKILLPQRTQSSQRRPATLFLMPPAPDSETSIFLCVLCVLCGKI